MPGYNARNFIDFKMLNAGNHCILNIKSLYPSGETLSFSFWYAKLTLRVLVRNDSSPVFWIRVKFIGAVAIIISVLLTNIEYTGQKLTHGQVTKSNILSDVITSMA